MQKPRPSRRQFLVGAATTLGGAMFLGGRGPVYGQSLAPPAEPGVHDPVRITLTPAERPTVLPAFNGHRMPLWTFTDDDWLPVVRVPFGARLEAEVHNQLPREGEHASIHWHGIRLPNDQDGVPYLVQDPVFPGSSYRYAFTPPDTGTFFFHTHCNTAEHFGRGLVGVLIVDGDTTEPYDADDVLLIRDWRIDTETGEFLSFTTSRGAARAGTYGPLRTVNGSTAFEHTLPAVADCRLRLINVDPTRTVDLGIEGADAAIIAVDGIAVPPFALERWAMGPAMRLDIVVRTPPTGGVARLVDYRPDEPFELAVLRSAGTSVRSGPFAPAPLREGHVPEPDLDNADDWLLEFGSIRADEALPPEGPLADLFLGPLCRSTNSLWTINEASWPAADHANVPPPAAELTLGRTYRVVLRNNTRLLHPIHFHGHSLKVLSSDKRAVIPHYADTILLDEEETIEAAFVASNPGRWMLHCHVAEHQETGMMGYFTVA